jgi:hypothetical protein
MVDYLSTETSVQGVFLKEGAATPLEGATGSGGWFKIAGLALMICSGARWWL